MNEVWGQMNTGQAAKSALVQLGSLTKPAQEVALEIGQIYSIFGEIRKVSNFSLSGKDHYFLVDFARGASAVNAANSTGCSMFGFSSVLVDLNKLAGCE